MKITHLSESEDFKKFKTKFSYLFDESNSTSVSSKTLRKRDQQKQHHQLKMCHQKCL